MKNEHRISASDGAALKIRNLHVDYRVAGRDLNVLRKIDLDIAPGEVVGVVGESGSGKSTLAYSIVRYLAENASIRADEMTFGGEDLLSLTPARLRELRGTTIGMVYQDPSTALNPVMTVGEQLTEALKRRGQGSGDYAAEVIGLLDMVRLPNPEVICGRYPYEISGGERQRVLIAIAFAMRPNLLIFDEATTALDATTAQGIIELIRDLQRETKVAILFISHDLGTVSQLADRIVLLYRGDILEEGPARSVLGKPSTDYTRRLLAARPNPFSLGQSPRRTASKTVLMNVDNIKVHHGKDPFSSRLFKMPSKRFMAVRGVSFEIAEGATVGLVGESGCGKSTLARALAGLSEFDGTVEFKGRKFGRGNEFERDYRRSVQIIFQNPDLALNPRLTVGELIGRPMKLYNLVPTAQIDAEVAKLLEAVRLPASYANRYTSQLSGGEKQRVSIARAFAAKPDLIICDEITSSLDVSVQAAILKLLGDLQREHGTAYIFITHDLQVLQALADDVLVMYLGTLVERRTLDGTELQPPLHPYSEALLSASPVADPTVITRKVSAEGPLPSPRNPPQGCVFQSRCSRNLGEQCKSPPPRQKRGEHEILCHIEWPDLSGVPPLWTRAAASETQGETNGV